MYSDAGRRILRAITVTVLAVSGVVVAPGLARAECAAWELVAFHRVTFPGETMRIDGTWFGDNCYDTGPPPVGEGVLGKPLVGIEIVLVSGELEWLLASGDADDEYAFSVEVQIPLDAPVGTASLMARLAGGQQVTDFEIEIVPPTDPVPAMAQLAPVRFGPDRIVVAPETIEPTPPANSPEATPTDSTPPVASSDTAISTSSAAPSDTVPTSDSPRSGSLPEGSLLVETGEGAPTSESRPVWPWLLGVGAVLSVTFVSLSRRRRHPNS